VKGFIDSLGTDWVLEVGAVTGFDTTTGDATNATPAKHAIKGSPPAPFNKAIGGGDGSEVSNLSTWVAGLGAPAVPATGDRMQLVSTGETFRVGRVLTYYSGDLKAAYLCELVH